MSRRQEAAEAAKTAEVGGFLTDLGACWDRTGWRLPLRLKRVALTLHRSDWRLRRPIRAQFTAVSSALKSKMLKHCKIDHKTLAFREEHGQRRQISLRPVLSGEEARRMQKCDHDCQTSLDDEEPFPALNSRVVDLETP